MRQKVGKKQSKHANSRVTRNTRSKRTRRRKSGKKRRVSVKMGGRLFGEARKYDAIVFDVDETILPKLCGVGKLEQLLEDIKKKKKYSYTNKEGQTLTFKLYDLKELVKLLTIIKNKGIPLFIATRCMSILHINHPIIQPNTDSKNDLHMELIKLHSLFRNNETDLLMLAADGSVLRSDPAEGSAKWAKYKTYFLQQLKEKLKEKLKKKDVKILFVDDDATNTKKANEAGFDTFTKNKAGFDTFTKNQGQTQTIPPDFAAKLESTYESPTQWTFEALEELNKSNLKPSKKTDGKYIFTKGQSQDTDTDTDTDIGQDQQDKIDELAEAAVTGLPLLPAEE